MGALMPSLSSPGGGGSQEAPRSATWETLRQKLRALVRMQNQWGNLWDIYETRHESVFEEAQLPPWTRDPDSGSSAVWDLSSVVLLLYVTVTVPLRACFGSEVEVSELT
jgi:hypothetical protein